MSLGLVRSGWEPVAAYDAWPEAVETYRKNVDARVILGSIDTEMEFPEADLIVGGPPCQGFSSAGMRRATDQRNTLVGVYAEIVARCRPAAFVFENVEGFLTGGDGKFVVELLEPLIEAGYWVHVRKVNAANFGVPQHRKRVLAIGGLGWDPGFPGPTHTAHGAPGSLLVGNRLPLTPSVADAIGEMPAAIACESGPISYHGYRPLRGADLARAMALRQGQRMRDLPEDLWHESYRRRAYRRVMDGTPSEKRGGAPCGVRRLAADEPSKAVTGGALREFLHPTEDRPLTLAECARLQTFPDGFVFSGKTADQAQLIGNAVPPLLAELTARHLRERWDGRVTGCGGGRLLSFVPTRSNGMSPVLQRVTATVQEHFGMSGAGVTEGSLWD
jgi:DNA (cytosine-5)-methyltransferase 1